MRFRLLRRRLTISAPRMAVRSHLPWPLRWAMVAIVLGFCAAIGLWAFEFGKDIAGIDGGSSQEAAQLREQLAMVRQQVLTLQQERDQAQTVANTSATLLTAEKAAQERLSQQNKQLEAENQALRDDLGFFERLIPATGGESLAIRGLQIEQQDGRRLRWQVLVIQPLKNAPEFNGRLELTFTGLQAGKPWSSPLPDGAQVLKFRQYGRLEGVIELPAQTVVKSVSAKVLDGTTTRAAHTVKL